MVDPTIAESILFFLLGLCFGSFGNVIIYRLPRQESFLGRSKDIHTGKILRAWELVPVLSFLLLRGRSRYSGKALPLQYPLVEIISGLLFVAALAIPSSNGVQPVFLAVCLWLLFLIAVIDAKTQFIPDAVSFALLVMAFLYSLIAGQFNMTGLVIGVGFFGLQWALSKGRWIGSGDILLAASIGLLMGTWQNMLLCLGIAYVLGAIVAAALLLHRKKKRTDMLAFAPFLTLATIITLLAGHQIFALLQLS